MDTATRAEPNLPRRPAPRPSRWVAATGPALIVASVLVALRGFAFAGRLSAQHPDLLAFWLPRSCFLGAALRDGRLPLWNPHELVGTPYLADPQSGWLSLMWMVLPTVFGCGAALAAIVVAQPILAGLGMHWFLRREGLGRPAATAGGLGLAMLLAQSKLAISMPFAGAIAWTPLLLVGASGYARASGWRRVPWLALGAFAWGQVATAHFSHGLVIATALGIAVLLAGLVPAARPGATTSPRAALLAVGFLAFLPLANLAILLPHAALLARSSLAEGYTALGGSLARAAGIDSRPLATAGVWAAWPYAFATTPGAYLGAVLLLAAPGALRDSRRRPLAVAVAIAMGVAYLLTLDLVVGAGWFRRLVLAIPYGDVYLHNPGRLRHLWTIGAPILGGLGLQAHLERPPRGRAAVAWLGAPFAVIVVWPLALGGLPQRFGVVALASAVGLVVARAVRARRPAALGVALVAVLTADLLGGALWSSSWTGGTVFTGLEGARPVLVPAPLRWPDQEVADILHPGTIVRALREQAGDDRYLAWVPPAAYYTKGYLFDQRPQDRPALLLGRAMLFGLDDVLGYSPVQLPRIWAYLRATNDLPLFYNAAAIQVPKPEDAALLGVGWLIRPEGVEPPSGLHGTIVAREGGFVLVRLDAAPSRTSLVGHWSSVPDTQSALAAVLAPGFDPTIDAVVEGAALPATGPGGAIGAAHVRWERPEVAIVDVSAQRDGLLVVREAWDRGWSATVDGRPTPVLVADALLQGVAVPAGTHEVRLTYRDPTIGLGLALSAAVWIALGVGGSVARHRARMAPATAVAPAGAAATPRATPRDGGARPR